MEGGTEDEDDEDAPLSSAYGRSSSRASGGGGGGGGSETHLGSSLHQSRIGAGYSQQVEPIAIRIKFLLRSGAGNN